MNAPFKSCRLACGWTHAELAERVCAEVEQATGHRPAVDAQAISRIERGEIRWPRAATRRALVALLGAGSETEIGLYPKRTHRDAEKDEATNRRDFLALAGTTVPFVTTAPHARQVGAVELDEMRAKFIRLQDLDNLVGGGDTFHLYISELARTQQLLRHASYSAATRVGLTELAGEQAQQAGWAAFDAGFPNQAFSLYAYSHRAAKEAGNLELAANALIQIAYATGDRNAVATADAACAAVGPDAPAQARALLAARRAWSLATIGDRDNAARALDAAASALDSDMSRPAAKWFAWMTHAELDIMIGRVWSVLHDPGKALAPLQRALDSYPDPWTRDKALYMTWLADSYLDAGNVEEAIRITENALTLAEKVASVRPLARVRQVARRAAGTPGGDQLRERAIAARVPTPARL
ncbi:helix-turn-helix domain-containing protein [Nocardia araoensis]|uniref:helix-turn-helix domain-containing protein n=1 Tax=Nocardia araoensis TaxID=228600 RepID=UPI000683FEF0|nr:helix-turn-helix transcriptional regulator [Nocardia araoensis]